MRTGYLRFLAGNIFILGLVSLLTGLEIIHNHTISENTSLKWIVIWLGISACPLAALALAKPDTTRSYPFLWYLAICTGLLVIPYLLVSISWYENSGLDFITLCGAVEAFDDGLDPYLIKHTIVYSHSTLASPYPPIVIATFFKLICIGESKITYYTLWGILLIAVFLLVRRAEIKEHRNFQFSLLAILLLTGFYSTAANFWAGNIEIISFFLFAGAIFFLLKRLLYIFVLFIGFAAFLKLWPLVFLSLLLLLPCPPVRKFKLIFLAVVSCGLPHLLSFLLYPDITPSYFSLITGRLDPSQHSPVTAMWEGSLSNPTVILAIRTFCESLLWGKLAPKVILITIYISFIITTFFHYTRQTKRSFLILFSLGMIAVMLVMPRLMTYSFTFALLPIYFLIKDWELKYKFMTFIIISVLPAISLLTFMMVSGHSTEPHWLLLGFMHFADQPGLSPLGKFTCYGQGLSLLTFYIYYLIKEKSFGFALLPAMAIDRESYSCKQA